MLVHRKTNHTTDTKNIRWTNALKTWWKNCGQSRDTWTLTKEKRWTFNLIHKNFPMKHLIWQSHKQNAKAFFCAANKTFGIQKKNVIDIDSWKIYDHYKGHHELYLNYNSENSSSS